MLFLYPGRRWIYSCVPISIANYVATLYFRVCEGANLFLI